MEFYDRYMKYKSMYLQLKYHYHNKGGNNILFNIEEKIKNNITITENLIYQIANIDTQTKKYIFSCASKYNHQEILKLVS